MSMPVRFPSLSDIFSNQDQPVSNNMFQVTVGVQSFGIFTKVSGLGYSVEPYEIVEGGRNSSAHIRPFSSPGKWSEVELEWGAVKRQLMESWVQLVAPGYAFRRNVFITQCDRSGSMKRMYILYGAWPKEWKVGELNSTGNDIATESLTLVCESIVTTAL